MTDTPQDPLDRLAAIVEWFIHASSTDQQDQIEADQLRFHEQVGDLARMIARHEQEIREFRQRGTHASLHS